MPDSSAPELQLFVDESYLHRKSATIQAGILVPADWYQGEARLQSQNLLRSIDKTATEFRANTLTPRTFPFYQRFLGLYLQGVASVSLTGSAASVVTVDGTQFFPRDALKKMVSDFSRALRDRGAVVDDLLLEEFFRQVAWFRSHGEFLITKPLRNPLSLMFDNKHSNAAAMNQVVVLKGPGGKTLRALGSDLLVTFLNSSPMLKVFRVGRVQNFQVRESQTEFGLQAADLLSNLFLASLRYEVGMRNRAIELRVELLRSFMKTLPAADERLAAALSRMAINESREDVICVDPTLSSRAVLTPTAKRAPSG